MVLKGKRGRGHGGRAVGEGEDRARKKWFQRWVRGGRAGGHKPPYLIHYKMVGAYPLINGLFYNEQGAGSIPDTIL